MRSISSPQRLIGKALNLLYFFLLSFSLHAEISEESEILSDSNAPLAALLGIPETNIHGVNVINGSFNYSSMDFNLPGSNPLVFQRTYCSSNSQDS